jgi:hypothetical protein
MAGRFDIEGKRISCATISDTGQVFAEAVLVSRRGGELEKIAGARHPAVDAYMKTLRPDPRMQYVLMTPMGSSEFWGRNVNGDYFPTLSLSYDPARDNREATIAALVQQYLTPFGLSLPALPIRDVFGHKSFLNALRYRHHVNKNPAIAYGDIALSVWNPMMRRVEVVSRHWRDKAAEVGADDIIKDIDEGRPRQISMGCKVPFDVCTICGHISRTTEDYCDCLKFHMGEIFADGRVAAALNLFPWFFDLSDVTTPAAQESGVIEKLAHARPRPDLMEKAAVMVRKAEVVKQVTSNVGTGARAAVMASSREADLPTSILSQGGLRPMLASLAAAGIVLKPLEFQFSVLIRGSGTSGVAQQMMRDRCCFLPTASGGADLGFTAADVSPAILRAIPSSVLQDRSGLDPYLRPRIVSLLSKTASTTRPVRYVDGAPAFRGLAESYAAYRQSLVKVAELVRSSQAMHPQAYLKIWGEDLDAGFAKAAGAYEPPALAECSLPVYVVNAFRVDPLPSEG